MEPPNEPPPQVPPKLSSPPPPAPPASEPVQATRVPDSSLSQPLMDDSQFPGSIMDEGDKLDATSAEVGVGAALAAEVTQPVKKRRGRPPKNGGTPKSSGAPKGVGEAKTGSSRKRKREEEEEEVVCFICFDGGDLVVCDKRSCPKVYHPACIHRDEAFFKTRGKWNCGWHICSMCQKNSQYMCYTCTYSSCRGCLKNAKFFRVRGSKGFCDTCFGTIVLIEDNNQEKKVAVDFDDKNSWEYLFKLYWVELKENLSLTIEELKTAKERWDPHVVPTFKTESTDDSYDANSDFDASSDGSSGRRKKGRGRKRGRRSTKNSTPGNGRPIQKARKTQKAQRGLDLTPAKEIEIKVMSFPEGTEWATPDMLDFVGHMRDGNRSYVSQYDVQALILDYIKKNNLRDPRKKSQIICDPRLLRLFGKPRVGHFEMLKLIEMHFLVKETSQATTNDGNNHNLGQVENGESGDMIMPKSGSDRRRKRQKVSEKAADVNIADYAAIDMHNIGLVYLRRGLMEELIDDVEKCKEKVVGAFVRIRIPGVVQKQDMYRLVKVVGTKAGEKYKVGKKMTDIMLEILNLDKKEIITADAISNQEFSEEECKKLRQTIKLGQMAPLKVGEVQEKARSLQFLRINELLENEKQRLSHLRDRASETGRRKELRECIEKLQILNSPEERERRLHEIPTVHSDPQMDPAYKSGDVPVSEMHISDGGRNKCGSREPGSRRRGREPKEPSGSTGAKESKNNGEIGTSSKPVPQFGVPPEAASSEAVGGEKVWHYRDPMGNIQGPFSIHQLAKWSSYFPPALKVWLMIDSEENSLLLTDILPKNLKVSAETKPTSPITVPGGGSTNESNAGSSNQNIAKLSSSNQSQPPSQASISSAVGTANDSGKVAQPNNSSNSIKEYGSIWSPTKSNLGSSSQQSRINSKEKPVVTFVGVPAPTSVASAASQSSSIPVPTSEKTDLKSSSSPCTASVPAQGLESGLNTKKVESKPKEDAKQIDQASTSWKNDTSIALTTTPTPDLTPIPTTSAPTSTPTPTSATATATATARNIALITTATATKTAVAAATTTTATATITALTTTATAPAPAAATITAATTTTTMITNLAESNSPEKEKIQLSENENPSPTPPTSDSPVAEPDDAPDESWPEVQVHESTGVEPWVPDPTTNSLDTGTSYPSDCLSPADILLSLSRVADEDLEDGDFLARMEALKKKSRLSDREEKHVVGPGVLDLSVTPDGASLQEAAECSQESKSALAVQKEAKPTTTGGEALFLQTDSMRTNSWPKLGDPLGADWSLPSPTPLATKTSGLGIDGISSSGHGAESMFISGAHQRAASSMPEPSLVLERTTYMDLNTTLQGSIGTGDMAPSPVDAGVSWSNSALQGGMNTTDVSHVTPVAANTGISWNMGAVDTSHAASVSANTGVTWSSTTMHGNMNPNHSEVRSTQANTGVTWSTLSGSVTGEPAPQPKPKPYNSWAKAIHTNSTNLGWATSVHTNSNLRSGWGATAPSQHANPNPNPNPIPEPQKEVATDPNASWGTTLALGNNTQSHWDTGAAGPPDWTGQWNRSSWHGGSQSRSQSQPARGQTYQRGICKFYESGYCKKGASCNYMHP